MMSTCPTLSTKEDQEIDLSTPMVTRTRSGRRVRTPAALLDSELRTPYTSSRRTRKSVIQLLPLENSEITPEAPESSVTECLGDSPENKDILSETEGPCGVPEGSACPDETKSSSVADIREVTLPHASECTPQVTSEETIEKENHDNKAITTVPDKGVKEKTHSESNDKAGPRLPLGKPKSGRVWKDRNKQRFSALVRDKPLRSSWEKKMEAKREKELVKKYHQQLKDETAREKEEKRKRREENLRRRTENERKAEIVQVIRNTAKIKRMKKKELRKIEKRDTLVMLQKSQPSKNKSGGKGGKRDH